MIDGLHGLRKEAVASQRCVETVRRKMRVLWDRDETLWMESTTTHERLHARSCVAEVKRRN